MRRGPAQLRERFVTLTLPHSGDVADDVATLRRAWRRFWRVVRRHLELDLGMTRAELEHVRYVVALEATPGSATEGHAHLHAYLLSPWLYSASLRRWWGEALAACGYEVPVRTRAEALEEARAAGLDDARLAELLVTRRGPHGRELERVPWPVLDVRAVHGDPAKELVKYMVKDAQWSMEGERAFVDPAVFARMYVALDGRRAITASRRFWLRHDPMVCDCGRCDAWRAERTDAPEVYVGERWALARDARARAQWRSRQERDHDNQVHDHRRPE